MSYRAVVIDGRKIIKRVVLIFALGISFMFLSLMVKNGQGLKIKAPEKILNSEIPVMSSENKIGEAFNKVFGFFLSFDKADMKTALFKEMPVAYAVAQGYLMNNTVVEGEEAVPKGEEKPIKAISSGATPVMINNQTGFSVSPEAMLGESLSLDFSGDGPKVLIIHTHTTESYTPEGADTYNDASTDRSLSDAENMIAVGRVMKNELEKAGIEVIHDTELHDYPSYNGSYAHALKAINSYLEKYPSIQVVLDVHRDAIVYDDGTKAKLVTEIEGKDAAQVMIVCGTNEGGLEHPNWRENLKFSVKMQNAVNNDYPGLMRNINLRTERFNGHTTKASIILEMGTSGNTIEEAKYSAELLGKSIGKFFNSI